MSKLNKDVILLILKELQNDSNSLYSCLLINRTWCEMAVPILWKDPDRVFGCCLNENPFKNIFNVILSHLSEESRDDLKKQGIDLSKEIYQQPLFNYIGYWNHLNLLSLYDVISRVIEEKTNRYILGKEIMKLFINNYKKFVSIFISEPLSSFISGSEDCFSELECFCCYSDTRGKILEGLALTSKQIRKVELFIICRSSNEIIKLIEAQKNLKEINFINAYLNNIDKKPFHKKLEESLIKHADTIQYLRIDWVPITKLFSHLVNLVSLDLRLYYVSDNNIHYGNLENVENVTLPLLKFLKAIYIPYNILSILIESAKGYLAEISIINHYIFDEGRLIRTIYQSCSNLKFLELSLLNENISEFENLLINCQYLNTLEVASSEHEFNWDELFTILTKSSPISLFKFKFISLGLILKPLKLFLDNWNERNPMILQISSESDNDEMMEDLMQNYKTKGVIKKYVIEVTYIYHN